MLHKKTALTMIFAFLWAAAFCQYFTIGEDVQSYSQGLNAAQQFVQSEMAKGYDLTIPASERILSRPTLEQAAQGNVGYRFHGVPEVEAYLDKTAGKVAFIIIDDCAGYDHTAIRWLPSLARNFTGEPAELNDDGKHSHHVAGITSAYQSGMQLGIAGNLNRDNRAAVVPLKALTYAGSGFYSWITAASNYAADIIPTLKGMGYDKVVVNYSLGGNSSSSAVDAAMKRIRDAGGIIYAANGNTGQAPVQYPGRSVYTDGVAALQVNPDGTAQRASYSSKGPETSIAGVGSGVFSCQPENAYAIFNGTSMASPMVAGIAGLLCAAEPELSSDKILQRVRSGSIDLPPTGKDDLTGVGFPVASMVLDSDSPPDNPDEPEEPEQPDFTSTLTYEIDGQKLRFRRATGTNYQNIKIDDMLVNVTGAGTTENVYDENQDWTKNFFSTVTMVIPDDPTWGHCLTTYWTGQFYEYWSRNDAIGAQVQVARGEDQKGRNCFQFEFNRANVTPISVYVTDKGKTVLSSITQYGVVTAIIRPERKGLRRLFLGR